MPPHGSKDEPNQAELRFIRSLFGSYVGKGGVQLGSMGLYRGYLGPVEGLLGFIQGADPSSSELGGLLERGACSTAVIVVQQTLLVSPVENEMHSDIHSARDMDFGLNVSLPVLP